MSAIEECIENTRRGGSLLRGGGVATAAHAELSALRAENARMREALTEIARGAPTEEPDRIETDNRDDCYTNGYERAEWAAAKIARAALGGRDE